MNEMDSGQLLKWEFMVLPGQNGSFVIRTQGEWAQRGGAMPGYIHGFTSSDDMLRFLADEAKALKATDGNKAKPGKKD
jgi:hypothetical protein